MTVEKKKLLGNSRLLIAAWAALLLFFSTVAFYHHHDLCGAVHYGFECSHGQVCDSGARPLCDHNNDHQPTGTEDCLLHISYVKDCSSRIHDICMVLSWFAVLRCETQYLDNQIENRIYLYDNPALADVELPHIDQRGPPTSVS